ncbi:MAG: DUF4157 domain-containing protein [Gammaproteobacteria bacterium]|nr:DUF4157 domain-containing protein [Gammaproteobacteria bacterium]
MKKITNHDAKTDGSFYKDQSAAHSSQSNLRTIQQAKGNLDFQYLLQPKLAVSQPNDPYEKEADSVANRLVKNPTQQHQPISVNSISSNYIQCLNSSREDERSTASFEPELIQPKSDGGSASGDGNKTSPLSLQNGGSRLDDSTQQFFESRLGRSLNHVRLHTSAKAAQATRDIKAKAFTLNNHIAFAPHTAP